MRGVRSSALRYLLAGTLAVAAAGCGKKGPPLAPIVRIPAAIEQVTARRIGSDVYVTLTVPAENIDRTVPSDVTRIDVYAYTGRTPPPRPRFTALGTPVASIPVVPAPPPDAEAPPPPDPSAGGIQGMPVTIVDRLTPDELQQGPVDPPLVRGGAPVTPAPVSTAAAAAPLRRFYMAIPFGPRNRPGPPGNAAEVVLTELPPPPVNVVAAQSAIGVALSWEPVGGLIGYLISSRELPREEPPFPVDVPAAGAPASVDALVPGTALAALPDGPTRYHVYREVAPDPLALPGPPVPLVPWRAVPPAPAAPPIAGLAFEEPAEFERERCYTVRTVRGDGPAIAESDPAPRVCVRPVDIFPPAPPAAPTAVAAEGAISLIWEPSPDADVGGYVVLRGEAGSATLAPITPTPVFEASYRDTNVNPGTRYVYAIQAVDNRVPVGNVSAPSPPVEETAR